MINNEKRNTKIAALKNPFAIMPDKDLPATKISDVRKLNTSAYKFMYTRDPYARLLSFYFDKLVAPVPYHWKVVGAEITRQRPGKKPLPLHACGHDVTFPEFIKYAIKTLKSGKSDPHWTPMETLCNPCEVNYTFIGKLENFRESSLFMTRKLRMDKMVEFLQINGTESYNNDAILDKVRQPFTLKRQYQRCMTFKDAVARTWYTLQTRGMVGNDPPPSIETVNTWEKLFERAKESKENTPKSVRKKMKTDTYREYWAQISLSDLQELRTLYARDFEIFSYEKSPSAVFQGRETEEINKST